jgi:hypothetical protein
MSGRSDESRPVAPGDLAIPILPMRSVDETRRFLELMGFAVQIHHGPSPYAIACRGPLEVHFFHHPDVDPLTSSAGCYLRVRDPDALHAEFVRSGAAAAARKIDPVATKPWGMREFAVIDPNGSLLRIGARL